MRGLLEGRSHCGGGDWALELGDWPENEGADLIVEEVGESCGETEGVSQDEDDADEEEDGEQQDLAERGARQLDGRQNPRIIQRKLVLIRRWISPVTDRKLYSK